MRSLAIACVLLLCSATTLNDKQLGVADVLANPSAWNGKTVTVTGYFTRDIEKRVLWASKADMKAQSLSASLWLNDYRENIEFKTRWGVQADETYLENKIVTVTGVFHHSPDTVSGKIYGHGFDNQWPAEIIEISSIQEYR
jgi:hypothetical protein